MTLIEHDADRVKDRLDAWERESSDSAAVLGALARRAIASGRIDEAIKLLDRMVSASGDVWAYRTLAKIYQDRGDRTRWRATLDDLLRTPAGDGVEHARVRYEIANDLMSRGRLREAWPYGARRGGERSAWGMQCAEIRAERMGDFDTAEFWYHQEAGRFPGNWGSWFFFCMRTGRGDLPSARDHAERILQALGERPDLSRPAIVPPEALGVYLWLTGRHAKAVDSVRTAYEKRPLLVNCLFLLTLADRLGDVGGRDRAIQSFRDRHAPKAPRTAKLIELFFPEKARSSKRPELKTIDETLESVSASERGEALLLAGVCLLNQDRHEDVRKYLKACNENLAHGFWVRTLAGGLLREPGPGGKARSR